MAEKVLIDDKAVLKSDTKVQFGALNAPTPLWATWVFRIVFILTTAAVFLIGQTALISAPAKVEIMVWLKTLDMVVLGISKLFGVVPDGK